MATTGAGVIKTQQARVSISLSCDSKSARVHIKTTVSENTPHLQVLANQQVSEVITLNVLKDTQKASEKPIQATCLVTVAEPTQYTILGLPIVHLPTVHLSLALENPPWIQLSQRGILPIAENICQTSQTFASRISLFRSNWKTLNLDGYHIPLLSAPLQQSPPRNPHLYHK